MNSSENEIITLHPNTPAHENDDFHLESDMKLKLELSKCSERIKRINLQINGFPAAMCKTARKGV